MELATINQPQAKRSPQAAKRERISKPVLRACELLASGKAQTIIDAAAAVGLSREHLGRMLQRSHVQAFLANEARRTIGTSIWRASQVMVNLLGAESEHVRAQVAGRLLTNEGILKSDQAHAAVSVAVSVGYVIDLSDPKHMTTVCPVENKPAISTVSAFE